MELYEQMSLTIGTVFNTWTALQLSIEHGMGDHRGGSAAVPQFVDYIAKVFCSKVEIDELEVEDILIDLLETEFNTICEDDSPREVAQVLCEAFRMIRKGESQELKDYLGIISPHSTWNSYPSGEVSVTPQLVNSVEHVFSDEEDMTNKTEEDSSPQKEVKMDVSDGWTVMKSKRRNMKGN